MRCAGAGQLARPTGGLSSGEFCEHSPKLEQAVAEFIDGGGLCPIELSEALRTRQWGLPEAGGWKDQVAGLLDKMTVCLRVYDALTAYRSVSASEQYEWIARHPTEYAIVQRMRDGRT